MHLKSTYTTQRHSAIKHNSCKHVPDVLVHFPSKAFWEFLTKVVHNFTPKTFSSPLNNDFWYFSHKMMGCFQMAQFETLQDLLHHSLLFVPPLLEFLWGMLCIGDCAVHIARWCPDFPSKTATPLPHLQCGTTIFGKQISRKKAHPFLLFFPL